MNGHVAMSLFKTVVLPNVMEVVSADHSSPLHFQFLDNSGQNTSSDGYISSEWTLFVNVSAFDGL